MHPTNTAKHVTRIMAALAFAVPTVGCSDDSTSPTTSASITASPPQVGSSPSPAVTSPAVSAPAVSAALALPLGSLIATDEISLSVPDGWSAYVLGPTGTVEPVSPAEPIGEAFVGIATASALQGGAVFASAAPEDPQADFMVITRIGTSGDAAATADGPFDVSQSLRDHLSALGVTDIVVDSLEVDGRPASRTSYRRPISGQNDPGSVGMSVLVAGETTDWLITISTAQPAPNDVVDTILGSFQLFET